MEQRFRVDGDYEHMYDECMSFVDDHGEQIGLSPDELVDAIALHERNAALLALAVAHVSATGSWADDRSVTMRSWMRANCRMTDSDAGAWLRRGRLLNDYADIAEAAVTGSLSSGQVGLVERLNRPRYEPYLRALQGELVEELITKDIDDTALTCAVWKQHADALVEETEPQLEPTRSLHHSRADDGAGLGRYTLDDAGATEWEKALQTASTFEGAEDTRSRAERYGDAMYDIAAFYNRNHDKGGTSRHHAHVGLSVNAATLGDTPTAVNDDDQRHMSPAHADALLCDCVIHKILRDAADAPVGFGRSRYSIPRKLFRQVAARDGGCRFTGCNRKVAHTEGHHIVYWRNMGRTEYWNIVLLCSRHHHLVHQQHLQLRLLPDGELRIRWPDGREHVTRPRGAPPRGAPDFRVFAIA
jgi:hypothetical protein